MSIVVTGSNGFIGKCLVNRLAEDDLVCERVTRTSNNGFVISSEQVDIVFHLAGKAHDDISNASYQDYLEANCDYAVSVAEECSKRGLRRFVYVSSISVYGVSHSSLPITESSSLEPKSFYGRSKLEAELQLHELSKALNFQLIIIRPAMVYGPNAPGNMRKLVSLCRKFKFIPFATKSNKRTFLYVENLVDFLLLSAQHNRAIGEIYTLSDGVSLSTFDLLEAISKGAGESKILFSPYRFLWKAALFLFGKHKLYHQLFEDLVVDISKAKSELSWVPPYSPITALKDSAKHYLIDR